MPKVFVNTAAWIALLDADDALHPAAERVWHQLLQQRTLLLASDFVLLELADAFSTPGSRKQAIAFIDDLWQSPAVRVVSLSRTLLNEGWASYSQRFDKGWGLTDCTSFVVMTQEKSLRHSHLTDTLSKLDLQSCCEGYERSPHYRPDESGHRL